MNKNLVRPIGKSEQDNLIAKLAPPAETFGVTIRKGAAETVLKRGTVLAWSDADEACVVLGTAASGGETLTPYAILADDVTVGPDNDAAAVAYRSGNFNRAALITAGGHSISAAEEQMFRTMNILFTDMM